MWGAQEYWASATAAAIASVLLLVFWNAVGGSITSGVARTVSVLACLTFSIFSIMEFRLVQKFRDHSWWMAPSRVEEVIAKVRGIAGETGASPQVVERVYRAIIAAFIEWELKAHAAL